MWAFTGGKMFLAMCVACSVFSPACWCAGSNPICSSSYLTSAARFGFFLCLFLNQCRSWLSPLWCHRRSQSLLCCATQMALCWGTEFLSVCVHVLQGSSCSHEVHSNFQGMKIFVPINFRSVERYILSSISQWQKVFQPVKFNSGLLAQTAFMLKVICVQVILHIHCHPLLFSVYWIIFHFCQRLLLRFLIPRRLKF